MKKRLLMGGFIVLGIVSAIVFFGTSQVKTEVLETSFYGIKPSVLSESELNKRVLETYQTFADKYYKTVPNKKQMYLDYIFDEREDKEANWVKRNAVTVSEAHGYAMVLLPNVANMDIENTKKYKEEFDQFYNFFRAHPSQYSEDLMCWQMIGEGLSLANGSGEVTDVKSLPIGNDSAIDGDMDIAYALVLADNVWGSKGKINYREEAIKVMKAIYDLEVNQEEDILLLGDWVIATDRSFFMTYTRSSDFMLNRLKTFAKVDTERSEEWQKIFDKTVQIINTQASENSGGTGLTPDFFSKDDDGNIVGHKGLVLEDVHDGDYNWNSCRYPWRISRDYLTTGDTSVLESIKMLDTFIQEDTNLDPEQVHPGYIVTSGTIGEPIPEREYWDLSYIAPFALSASASGSQEWLDNLWVFMESIPVEDDVYFGNVIKMHAYMILSGNMINPQ